MTPALALQKAIRARLTADASVTALVPADAILDVHGLPERFPCIILGEGQELPADTVARRHFRVHATLHVWQAETGTTGVKAIAGAVRRALRDAPWPADGHHVHDLAFTGATFLRDPDNASAHGVVTFEAILEERP